jgi:hypothetical protein
MSIARKLPGPSTRLRLRHVSAIALSILVLLHGPAQAESGSPPASEQLVARQLSSHFPDRPSIAPSWSFPVEPFGFTAPGQNYLGTRTTMLSLDFLGENRLLFTFRVPGLMRREPGKTAEDQRQIRAVVLALPSGAVQAQADWTMHDRARYLWTLDDDKFLLRDRNTILEGNTALPTSPCSNSPERSFPFSSTRASSTSSPTLRSRSKQPQSPQVPQRLPRTPTRRRVTQRTSRT